MTLLPDVRQELYETAARRAVAPGHRGRRGWLRAGVRTVPVAVAVAVALLVLVVALLALKPGHGQPSQQQPAVSQGTPPPIPGLPPAGTHHYIDQANTTVYREDHACAGPAAYGGISPRRDSFRSGSPPRAMLSAFSILAAPTTKDDRRMIALIKRHGRDRLAGMGSVYINDVREGQYRYGGGYFLVPVADAFIGYTPVRCDREELAAVRHAVAHAPRAVRAGVLRYEAAELAYRRYDHEHPDGICLEHLNDQGYGGGGCGETTYDLRVGIGGGLTGGEGDNEGGWIEAGIIPDGVATVTVRYPAHRSRTGRRLRGFTATVAVVNNVVVIKIPPRATRVPKVTWRSATGAVIPHAP